MVPTEPPPTLSPQAVAGQKLFTRECASCHSLSEDTIIVGPSLAHVATVAADRVAGQSAEAYLMSSILNPNDYIVADFDGLMPSTFGKELTGEEIDALVAYLLTLE